MSSTALIDPTREVRSQLVAMEEQFAFVLPKHIPVERFRRVGETAIMKDPKLAEVNRKSLLQAFMQSAECGLMPDGREAAIVRYGPAATFVPMFAGMLKLVRNSGAVKDLVVELVYSNDKFTYTMGDEPKIEHAPAMTDRGNLLAAYAILKTLDGGTYRALMNRGEIDRIRNASNGYRYAETKGKDSPWHKHYEEMAKKTVIRRLFKICPVSTDLLDKAIEHDNNTIDLAAFDRREPSKTEIVAQKLSALGMPMGDAARYADSLQEDEAVEAETIVEGAPAADEEALALKEGAVFDGPSEALADLRKNLPGATTAADVKSLFDGWVMMVEGSFFDADATPTIDSGRKLFNQRKLELQKAAQK